MIKQKIINKIRINFIIMTLLINKTIFNSGGKCFKNIIFRILFLNPIIHNSCQVLRKPEEAVVIIYNITLPYPIVKKKNLLSLISLNYFVIKSKNIYFSIKNSRNNK